MARIRTKPRKKYEQPKGGLIGCILIIVLGIAFVTWIFFVILNPDR